MYPHFSLPSLNHSHASLKDGLTTKLLAHRIELSYVGARREIGMHRTVNTVRMCRVVNRASGSKSLKEKALKVTILIVVTIL